MKINKIFEGIIEIEDFVSKEECNSITSFANSVTEDVWFKENGNIVYNWWNGKVLPSPKQFAGSVACNKKIELSFDTIEQRVHSLFLNYLEITGINLNRYKNNDFLNYHTDEWLNSKNHFIRYGIIIYYNDDYEGGELHYKDLDFTYKPKAGSLIIHGGDKFHGTLPVKSNSVRYSSTIFVKERRGNSISLNKEIFGDINEL